MIIMMNIIKNTIVKSSTVKSNSVKSNRLPDYKTNFKLVLARNEKMNLKFYDSNNFDKLYDDCLREYHGDRGFFINKYKK